MGKTKSDLEDWPTPNASTGGGDTGNTKNKRGKQAGNPLKTATGAISGKKLNPDWVEQLQGLPVGHTQLSGVTGSNENRIDRLRLLGNGVVPQTAEKAFETLLGRIF